MMLRPIVLSLLACCLSLAGAANEAAAQNAAPSSHLQMTMSLYAIGFPLGKVDLDATIHNGEYHAASNLETTGIVSVFWRSKIQASSSGAIAPGHFQPALYRSFALNRGDRKQEVSLTYDGKDSIKLFAAPPYDTARYPVSDAQKKGTYDPLSAIVYIAAGAASDAKEPCSALAPVFDGKRRYNIEIAKEKDVQVDMDLYKGPAVECIARYNQLAGFSQRILSEKASFPKIHAWLAVFPSNIPGRHYVVPLRVWADSFYGRLSAFATTLKIDGVEKKTGK